MIAWRGLEVVQGTRAVEVVQLPARHSLDRGEATDRAVLEEGTGVLGREGSDHGKSIGRSWYYVKRTIGDAFWIRTAIGS